MNESNFTYSVTIRTLGTGGDKYRQTLKSIAAQTIRPEEVIVVLPHGASLPPERLGGERFVFSQKGMVSQRVAGFAACHSNYLLALDDDVAFDADFVAQMRATLQAAQAQFVSPVVRDLANMGGVNSSSSPSALKRSIDWLMGVSIHRSLSEPLMVKIWRTGGFIVNTNIAPDRQYYNESGHGTCIFGQTRAIAAIHFEEELWLEDTRYALPEDMVFYHKLFLHGYRIAVNRAVRFVHLDAGNSTAGDDKRLVNTYASARNGFIFWHRTVYRCRDRRWLSALCMARRICFTLCFALAKGALRRDFSQAKTYLRAYRDGFRFVHSSRYKQLTPIPTTR